MRGPAGLRSTGQGRQLSGGGDLTDPAATGTGLLADGALPARWVVCAKGFGRSVDFRDGVAALGPGSRAEVPADTRLWLTRPPTLEVRMLAVQLDAEAACSRAWHRRAEHPP